MNSERQKKRKPLRVLLTADPEIPVPPEHYGGVQRLVDGIANELGAKGYSVGLVAHPESSTNVESFFPFPGLQSQRGIDTIRNTLTLYSAVRKFQPDVLHSFSRLMYMLPLYFSSLPKIMTYGRSPGFRQVRWSSRLSRGSLAFTACSNHIREIGKRAGGEWHTVYNFLELDLFSFQARVEDDAPLVFLSRLERIKGAHSAIEVARRAGRRLLIAGNRVSSSEGDNYWRSEIEPHIGKDGIEYVGPVDDKQKNELLGKALAMILPIEWEEPFGIVFIEALACGTPVIACPRGAFPEIVREGVEGLSMRSIDEGVAQVEKVSQISRAACRQRVEQMFTQLKIVEQYEQIYYRMVEKIPT